MERKNLNETEHYSTQSHEEPRQSTPADGLSNSLPSNLSSTDRTYKKKGGSKDFGREFKLCMCGYYSLKLAINDDVKDFEMSTSNVDDGQFGDFSVKITFANGNVKRFLFQLIYKENKKINLGDLKSKSNKNDFSVTKYIESITKTNIEEETACILFTNASTKKLDGNVQLSDGVFLTRCNISEFGDVLINTAKGHEEAIFETKSENLKQTFYFFTSQMSVTKTEEKISTILKRLLNCEIHGHFANYMRYWWSTKLLLTKHDIIDKISELAFSPYLKILGDKKCNEKTENLKQAIMDFPVTIVEDCGEDIVENIWDSDTSCSEEEFTKTREKFKLKGDQKNVVLWYLGKVPLIVKVDHLNEKRIKCVMNFLVKGMGNKKIVLSGQVAKTDFKLMDTFETLHDVIKRFKQEDYCSNILKKFNVSLQGRRFITLESLLSVDSDMAKLIGTKELLQMSQEKYLLIENQKEELPNFHIPRTISPFFVTIEDIFDSYQSSHNTLLIVNCDETFASKLSTNEDYTTMELSQYFSGTKRENLTNLILLSTRSKCTHLQFERICTLSEKSNVYLLQNVGRYCILVFRKSKNIKFEDTYKKTINEHEIFDFYDNHLHVFCGPPGTGKSTLMKSLFNICPSDYLAVYVSLINYDLFLALKPSFEAILAQFLEDVGTGNDLFKQLKKYFWQKQRLYLFLDGLDEVSSENVERILKFVKYVSSQDVKIWVSSRENLKERICQTLNTVPIDIIEVSEEEQKNYMQHKLKRDFKNDHIVSYKDEEVEKITETVFNIPDLNNSRNLLGVLLQLHIITEMFLHDRQVFENLDKENFFIITKIFQRFFLGKLELACNELNDEDKESQLIYAKLWLQGYELLALEACLDSDIIERLHLHDEIEEANGLLHILKEGDEYGIMKATNETDEAVFEHQIYAEYFACVWFKRNPEKIVLLRDNFFSGKSGNLRPMFDIMLAENNPLHLAIIYKDMEHFENHIQDIGCEDQGGRTPMHLAFSYGQKYGERPQRETKFYVKMIEIFLQEDKILEKSDKLFALDCINYALQSECLYPIERMLGKKWISFESVKKLLKKHYSYDKISLANYSAQLGYPNLLSGLIKKHLKNELRNDTHLLKLAVKGCEGDVCTSPREGNIQAVKILIKSAGSLERSEILKYACVEKFFDMLEVLSENQTKCDDGNTILHLLVTNCSAIHVDEIVTVVKKFNIDINARNTEGATALHKAAESADLKILETLLEIGADPGIVDENGQTVLDYATLKSRRDVIKFFLDAGLDVNRQHQNGTTIVHLASKEGKTQILKTLLDYGADPELTDKDNNNALHYALRSKDNIQDTADLLLKNGLDVNRKNDYGLSPIHLAYKTGNFKNADFLLELGANPEINAKFTDGKTPLHLACQDHQRQNVKELLKRGSDPNILDNDGRNALHYYLDKFYAEDVIHAMIGHDISLHARYVDGQTLLHIVCGQGDSHTIRKLVERFGKKFDLNGLNDDKQNVLHQVLKTVQNIEPKVRDRLINRYKYGINIQHEHDSNRLQFGCEGCYYELLESLPLPKNKNFRNKIFMFVGNDERTDIFVKYVPNSDFGSTRIFVAARIIIFEMISYLIDNGLEMKEIDVFGKTALDYASELKAEYPEIINLLSKFVITKWNKSCLLI